MYVTMASTAAARTLCCTFQPCGRLGRCLRHFRAESYRHIACVAGRAVWAMAVTRQHVCMMRNSLQCGPRTRSAPEILAHLSDHRQTCACIGAAKHWLRALHAASTRCAAFHRQIGLQRTNGDVEHPITTHRDEQAGRQALCRCQQTWSKASAQTCSYSSCLLRAQTV